MSGLIFLIAMLAGLLVLWLFYPRNRKVGVLNEAYSVDTTRQMHELDPSSLQYKLLASGLSWKPVTFRTFQIGGAVTAFVAGSGLLGPIVGVVLAGVVYYAFGAWLNDKVLSRGKEIDKHLPIAVGRIAAGLLAGGSPPEVLNAVAASLELEGKSPLTPELYLTAAEMRTKDRREALVALAERSPSVSLSNMATLLIGYIEAGGGKYAETLMDISQRVQQILSARNRAQAKAGDVMVSTVILPVILVLVVGYLSSDPLISQSLRAGLVQMVMAGAVLAMVFGYFILRSMVQEAV
ncbi:MAG: type II secretion system F family protein [Anaerolineae bacterium]|nr:type II secretion system F family protein [Anaerolineae bacterium]